MKYGIWYDDNTNKYWVRSGCASSVGKDGVDYITENDIEFATFNVNMAYKYQQYLINDPNINTQMIVKEKI